MDATYTKQILIRIDAETDYSLTDALEHHSRAEFPTKSDLIRKALTIGLAKIAADYDRERWAYNKASKTFVFTNREGWTYEVACKARSLDEWLEHLRESKGQVMTKGDMYGLEYVWLDTFKSRKKVQ